MSFERSFIYFPEYSQLNIDLTGTCGMVPVGNNMSLFYNSTAFIQIAGTSYMIRKPVHCIAHLKRRRTGN